MEDEVLTACSLTQNNFECPLPACADSCAASCVPPSTAPRLCDSLDDDGDCQALCDLWDSTGQTLEGWCEGSSLCGWKGVVCEDGRVTELSMEYSQQAGIVPESIGRLSKVKMLFLGNNGFTGTLPESLGSLTQLVSLGLDRNKFRGS